MKLSKKGNLGIRNNSKLHLNPTELRQIRYKPDKKFKAEKIRSTILCGIVGAIPSELLGRMAAEEAM